jgi:nucleoporin GLE1
MNVLKDSLSMQSPPMDPSTIMCAPPTEEVVGAINNGSMLPTLFIYFLNIFAKSIVSQFINEAGVSPKAATPIGTIAVTVFAKPDFLWRGQTLIDILMCKMRVSCPVLFGMRGSEKTEEGRARVGWKRENGHWIDEQVHASRMTGLAAGYAAMSLRDFSRSKVMKNPWPATNYWRSFASIVDTPPDQACSTQYTVLKAMIENHEDRFLRFYGDAAKVALYIGCVVFPARAVEKSVAVSALSVTADRLLKDVGLRLTPPQARGGQGVLNSSSGFGTFH